MTNPDNWTPPTVDRLAEAGDSANGEGTFNDGVAFTYNAVS